MKIIIGIACGVICGVMASINIEIFKRVKHLEGKMEKQFDNIRNIRIDTNKAINTSKWNHHILLELRSHTKRQKVKEIMEMAKQARLLGHDYLDQVSDELKQLGIATVGADGNQRHIECIAEDIEDIARRMSDREWK